MISGNCSKQYHWVDAPPAFLTVQWLHNFVQFLELYCCIHLPQKMTGSMRLSVSTISITPRSFFPHSSIFLTPVPILLHLLRKVCRMADFFDKLKPSSGGGLFFSGLLFHTDAPFLIGGSHAV